LIFGAVAEITNRIFIIERACLQTRFLPMSSELSRDSNVEMSDAGKILLNFCKFGFFDRYDEQKSS
jgi:hypothetical protein